jgi:hypothetical protein
MKNKEKVAREYAQKRGDFKSNDCWQEQFSSFLDGALEENKSVQKLLRDLKNKYKSELRDKKYVKLDKRDLDQEKISVLEAKIGMIEEIEEKLSRN